MAAAVDRGRRAREAAAPIKRERPGLDKTPATRFLSPGGDGEGFWAYEQLGERAMDITGYPDAPEPGRQPVSEVNHSAGRCRADCLNSTNMAVGYRGRQTAVRESTMTKPCVSPQEAKMYLSRGKWTSVFLEGATIYTADSKSKLGETQRISFAGADPNLSYDSSAPSADMIDRKTPDRRGMGEQSSRQAPRSADGEAADKDNEGIVRWGRTVSANRGQQPSLVGAPVVHRWYVDGGEGSTAARPRERPQRCKSAPGGEPRMHPAAPAEAPSRGRGSGDRVLSAGCVG